MQTTKTKRLHYKYKRLSQRLGRQIQSGRFSTFAARKQHQLLSRLQRYARRLAILMTGILLGGSPLTGLAQTPMSFEFKVNAFTGGEQDHPDAAASPDGKSVIVYESEDLDGDGKGIYFKLYDENGTQIGVETRVNTYTTGNQSNPSVAMDTDGDFVVVWESYGQDVSDSGIYGQGFDANGISVGSEFLVNTYTTSNQRNPSIALDADGDFIVVWSSYGQDGSGDSVYGQRYAADGTAVGGEFHVNNYTTDAQTQPSVAMDDDGNFAVVWQSFGQASFSYDAYGQRYAADGMAIGGEFLIDTYATTPVVAMDKDGDFVTAWTDGVEIMAQRYAANGAAIGSDFQVNTYTTATQSSPSLAMNSEGDFVVAWQSQNQDGDLLGVYGQRYFADGTTAADEFQVNTFTTGSQRVPAVAMDDQCGFVVAWANDGNQGGFQFEIYAQRYFVGTGEEFRVNTFTISSQRAGSVAMDADGDFVVVWESFEQDGSFSGIYGQCYSSDGAKQGGEFLVNTYTLSDQGIPSVARDTDGDFVVVWESRDQDGDGQGIYGQRYSSDGIKQGGEFQVNTYTTNRQCNPSVAMDTDGDFVVVWHSFGQDGSGYGVYGQRYLANGTAVGSEFQVNTFTTSSQQEPSVAMDDDGDFVIAWTTYGQGVEIYGQRYLADGTIAGNSFQVNTYTLGNQEFSSVAMDADGDFVVVWESRGQDGSDSGIYGQRYLTDGTMEGNEFQVNSYTISSQKNAIVTMDADGDFLVVWRSFDQDGSSNGIYGQRYLADGTTVGGEFQINNYTADSQASPSVAMDVDGDFVAVWQSIYQDGSSNGIYAQVYQCQTSESACSSDPLTLSGMETGMKDHLSQAEIISTQSIENGAEVTYESAILVELQTNFHAKNGSTFTARIDDCGVAAISETPPTIDNRSAELPVESISTIPTLQVFPNPTNGMIQFVVPSEAEVQNIALYDQLGKRLKRVPIEERELSMEELARGIYFLTVQTADGTYLAKVIKQ